MTRPSWHLTSGRTRKGPRTIAPELFFACVIWGAIVTHRLLSPSTPIDRSRSRQRSRSRSVQQTTHPPAAVVQTRPKQSGRPIVDYT
eukprot:6719567-Prymnesium_polylepis.2